MGNKTTVTDVALAAIGITSVILAIILAQLYRQDYDPNVFGAVMGALGVSAASISVVLLVAVLAKLRS